MSVIPFILFAVGAFLVFVNFYTASTVLPLYIDELGGTEFDIGLQTILFYLTSILCRFYFGPLTDRKGRKIPLSIGAFIFCTAPLLFWISSNVNMLHLARVYQAIGLAAFFSSAAALAADFAPPGRVGLFMGLYRLIFTVALLSGPSTALAIIYDFNYNALFLFSFAIGLLSFGLIIFIKTPNLSKSNESTEANLVQTLRTLVTYKKLHPVFYGYALLTAGYGITVTFVILYIARYSHVNNPGTYFTYFCLAGIVTSLVAGYWSDRVSRQNIAWPAVIIMGVGIALLFPVVIYPEIMIISSVVNGIGFTAGIAVFMAWLIDETEEEIRGTVLAIQESVFDLFFGMGSFLFGCITIYVEMDLSFLMAGVFIFAIGSVFLVKSLMNIRHPAARNIQ